MEGIPFPDREKRSGTDRRKAGRRTDDQREKKLFQSLQPHHETLLLLLAMLKGEEVRQEHVYYYLTRSIHHFLSPQIRVIGLEEVLRETPDFFQDLPILICANHVEIFDPFKLITILYFAINRDPLSRGEILQCFHRICPLMRDDYIREELDLFGKVPYLDRYILSLLRDTFGVKRIESYRELPGYFEELFVRYFNVYMVPREEEFQIGDVFKIVKRTDEIKLTFPSRKITLTGEVDDCYNGRPGQIGRLLYLITKSTGRKKEESIPVLLVTRTDNPLDRTSTFVFSRPIRYPLQECREPDDRVVKDIFFRLNQHVCVNLLHLLSAYIAGRTFRMGGAFRMKEKGVFDDIRNALRRLEGSHRYIDERVLESRDSGGILGKRGISEGEFQNQIRQAVFFLLHEGLIHYEGEWIVTDGDRIQSKLPSGRLNGLMYCANETKYLRPLQEILREGLIGE